MEVVLDPEFDVLVARGTSSWGKRCCALILGSRRITRDLDSWCRNSVLASLIPLDLHGVDPRRRQPLRSRGRDLLHLEQCRGVTRKVRRRMRYYHSLSVSFLVVRLYTYIATDCTLPTATAPSPHHLSTQSPPSWTNSTSPSSDTPSAQSPTAAAAPRTKPRRTPPPSPLRKKKKAEPQKSRQVREPPSKTAPRDCAEHS